MPHDQGWSIEAPLASYSSEIREFVASPPGRWASPEGLEALERRLHRRAHRFCDIVMAIVIHTILVATRFSQLARRQFRDETPGRWRSKGKRPFTVEFLGGSSFTFQVGYLVDEEGDGWEGRQGAYPAMMALGIGREAKVSPALGGEVLRAIAESDSFEEAGRRLARRDIEMTQSRLYSVWEQLSGRLLEDRRQYLEAPDEDGPIDAEVWRGARVVISLDGGRCRMRKYLGGRPRKSGYRSFETDWREPKLVTIYAVDEDGERVESIEPIIDGTMGDADRVFELLDGYLEAIDVSQAAQVTVTADGAKWIWNRAAPLLADHGVSKEDLREVVDLWHARQHLWEIVEMPEVGWWDEGSKRVWFERFNTALEAGDIERLEERVEQLQDRCDRSDLLAEVEYFRERADKLKYEKALEEGRPIGSGAIESAIRRIVGLRMKGAGMFWTEPGAERMLLVRSWLKAGRLEDMWAYSTRRHARGWSADDASQLMRRSDVGDAA